MLLQTWDYLILLIAAFLATSILTIVMRKIALHLNIFDSPTQNHKTHEKPIPYLGGLAIVFGILFIAFVGSLFSDFTGETLSLAATIFVPAFLMSAIGLVDDIKELQPFPRFMIQNFIGASSAVFLISTNTLGSPFGNYLIDFVVTFIWLVGLMNSINFFDNIDGGAAGTVAITSTFLTLMSISNGQVLIAAMSIVLAGSTIGFLLWNKPPARIYMGDAGSLFLGTILGALLIRLDSSHENSLIGFTVIFLLIGIPILDTTVVVVDRLRRRVSPFKGGRDHLSHRLLKVGMSRQVAILVLWSLSVLLGLLALMTHLTSYNLSIFCATLGMCIFVFLFLRFMRIPVEK